MSIDTKSIRERAELAVVDALRAELAVAQQATTCASCGVFKHTPNRMDGEFGGYVCGGCMEQRIHDLRAALAQMTRERDAEAEQARMSGEAFVNAASALYNARCETFNRVKALCLAMCHEHGATAWMGILALQLADLGQAPGTTQGDETK